MANNGSVAAAAVVPSQPGPVPAPSTTTTTNIDPAGDIVLIIGTSRSRLRVSLRVLYESSEYFKNLLSEDWAEGQHLRSGGSNEFRIQGDNEKAVTNICWYLHYPYSVVHWATPPEEIYNMAVVADKYDICNALSSVTYAWINPNPTTMKDVAFLLMAAYFFRNEWAFFQLTKGLICGITHSFVPLANWLCDDGFHYLLSNIPLLLQERRVRIISRLHEIIAEGRKDIFKTGLNGTGPRCHCSWANSIARKYDFVLRRWELEPDQISVLSVKGIMDSIKLMEDHTNLAVPLRSCRLYQHTMPDVHALREKRLIGLQRDLGLCLECVRLARPLSREVCFDQHLIPEHERERRAGQTGWGWNRY